MPTTNVPGPTLGPTGFTAPSEASILTGVQADINAAFGGGLNPGLSTPQGQLASSMAAVLGNVNSDFLGLANGVDPAFAAGRMQDGIARIYFLSRNPSLPTVIQVQCNGATGVVIPVGATVTDVAGNTYSCTTAGTIASTGSITLPFANLTPGPLAVPVTVTVFQAIPGWDSATLISGVIGTNVESRADFEKRRQNAVAANSVGQISSIRGAVLQVSGVLDAYVTENPSNSIAIIGGVTLNPNSLYVAVVGGSAAAVAQAIWQHKSPGCAYNGNTTVTVQDTNSGYSPPFPSYQVTYQIPTSLNIYFSINIVNSPQVPAGAAALVQSAVISSFTGQDGGVRATIGSTILASRFFANVAAIGPWAQINSLQIGSNNTPSAIFTGSINGGGLITGTVLTVTAVSQGSIKVGDFISSTGGTVSGTQAILAGTQIVSQLSGTVGAIGTYSVTNVQTVPSQQITSASPNLNKLSVNINQEPALVSPNINVVFT